MRFTKRNKAIKRYNILISVLLIVLFLVLVSNREGWKFYAIGRDGFHSYKAYGKVHPSEQSRMGEEHASANVQAVAEKVSRIPFLYRWNYSIDIDCDNRQYRRFALSRQGPFSSLMSNVAVDMVPWKSIEEMRTMKKLHKIVCNEDKVGTKDE